MSKIAFDKIAEGMSEAIEIACGDIKTLPGDGAHIERIMVAGNNLASYLIGAMGPDFPKYGSEYADVRAEYGEIADAWACWNALMCVRDLREAAQANPPSTASSPDDAEGAPSGCKPDQEDL